MHHPVADFPDVHVGPLIAYYEHADGHITVVISGRQGGHAADLLMQPR